MSGSHYIGAIKSRWYVLFTKGRVARGAQPGIHNVGSVRTARLSTHVGQGFTMWALSGLQGCLRTWAQRTERHNTEVNRIDILRRCGYEVPQEPHIMISSWSAEA